MESVAYGVRDRQVIEKSDRDKLRHQMRDVRYFNAASIVETRNVTRQLIATFVRCSDFRL